MRAVNSPLSPIFCRKRIYSSPPYLHAMSDGPHISWSAVATSRIQKTPVSCPYVSLTDLKLSISINPNTAISLSDIFSKQFITWSTPLVLFHNPVMISWLALYSEINNSLFASSHWSETCIIWFTEIIMDEKKIARFCRYQVSIT